MYEVKLNNYLLFTTNGDVRTCKFSPTPDQKYVIYLSYNNKYTIYLDI